MSHPPCMVVLPWKQRPAPLDRFYFYRWATYPVRGRILVVPYNKPAVFTVRELIELWNNEELSAEAYARSRVLNMEQVHLAVHEPIAGLLVAWPYSKPPTLQELGRFAPEDWFLSANPRAYE